MDIITTHINADFDCLGSMVAARLLHPEAVPVFPGAVAPNVKAFLARNPSMIDGFKRPSEIDFSKVERLILVDVHQAERIGLFGELLHNQKVERLIYDHHPNGRAEIPLSDSVQIESVGSTVTLLSEKLTKRGLLPSPEEATLMALGLYEDTGNLLFNSTTERDYQAAAFLLRCGADLNQVAEALIQEMTADQVALLHQLLESREILNIRGIEIVLAHATVPRFIGDIASLAHRIKDMERLDALILVVRMEDRIFLVGRSRRPEVAMGEILAEFGGGGHPQAASAIVRDETLVQVLERLPQVLSRLVKPHWEVRHLMTTPVKTIPAEMPIDQARAFLTRYNINAVPVLEGDQVVGILTRQTADKAAYHGLESVDATEYMHRDFATVTPATSIDTLIELIVHHNQRFVPVLEGDRLVGAITRTDLLRHMISDQRALLLAEGKVASRAGKGMHRQVDRRIRELLPKSVQILLHNFGGVADSLGVEAYAVGGFVRDLLLRADNLDIDIVIEGDGIAFAEEFARRYGGRVRSHDKFSTAVLILPDGFKVDIASSRMEYYLEPGALPTVEHASLKLDLYRRDFTINTLAFALNRQHFGELYDFYGGRSDLNSRMIRVLHNLSFVEDPTRAFRAIRFEQRLGFKIGPHTESLLRSAVRMRLIEKVGGPRLLNELIAILREEFPLHALQRLDDFGLLAYLHPVLKLDDSSAKLFSSAEHALHWYELLYTGETIEKWKLFFLCLSTQLAEDDLEEMVARLRMPQRIAEALIRGRGEAHKLLAMMQRRLRRAAEPRPSELYQWFHGLGTVHLLYLTAKVDREDIRRWLSRYFVHLRGVEPHMSGNDIERLGYSKGPLYRQIISQLRAAQLDGIVKTKQDEIAFVKKRFPL